jgi:hypothetical protein
MEKGIIRKEQGQTRHSLREQGQRIPIKQATIILFQFYKFCHVELI